MLVKLTKNLVLHKNDSKCKLSQESTNGGLVRGSQVLDTQINIIKDGVQNFDKKIWKQPMKN